MMLLLDVGNTAVKWGLADRGRISSGGRFVHRDTAFDTQATQAWSDMPMPAAIVVANVAGTGMGNRITRWADQQWQLAPEFIQTSQAACGVTNAYTVPGDLGVDRWAALVGAHHAHAGAVCVVDCGTAITIDLIAATGEHRGGLILPGANVLQQTLLENTAGIQQPETTHPAVLLACGTRDAVNSGALYLAAAAIDRIVNGMSEAAGGTTGVVMTGGDAERVLPLLAVSVHHEPDLVLQGLAILSAGGN